MKNTAVIAFTALCLFHVLGTAASVRRTISDCFGARGESWKKRDQREVKSVDDSITESEEQDEEILLESLENKMIDRARAISSVLVDRNLTTFLELLNEAGLTEWIDSMNNITLFVPTNEVLAAPETADKVEDLREDKYKLREVLLFHMTGPEVQTCDSNTEVKSVLSNKSVRFNNFKSIWFKPETRFTLECAQISEFDPKVCEERVCEIDRLLQPPTGSVYDIIQRDPKYSIIKEILQGTKVEEVLKSGTSITFLAPVNDVFKSVEPYLLDEIKNKKCIANAVMGHLVLQEMVCGARMGRYSKELVIDYSRNLRGKPVTIVNGLTARVEDVDLPYGCLDLIMLDCDNMATNGVIHSVNHGWPNLSPWLVKTLRNLQYRTKTEDLCGI